MLTDDVSLKAIGLLVDAAAGEFAEWGGQGAPGLSRAVDGSLTWEAEKLLNLLDAIADILEARKRRRLIDYPVGWDGLPPGMAARQAASS